MKAIIISLNCVIDSHFYFDEFKYNNENRIIKKTVFAAGKGTNVAKVLDILSVPYKLFLLLGEENKDFYNELLSKENISSRQFYCNGKTRENISLHGSNIMETRLCEDNFYANDEICLELLNCAFEESSEGDILVLTGRLPRGISKNILISQLEKFREKNISLIIDSTSFTLEDYKMLQPFLVKPNEDEIKLYGKTTEESVKNLLRSGVKNVAFSQGKKGITLFNNDFILNAIPPDISPLSTVGAGDSSIAGFISGYIKSEPISNCLKLSVACGSANCMTDGGFPPTIYHIEKCLNGTIIQ